MRSIVVGQARIQDACGQLSRCRNARQGSRGEGKDTRACWAGSNINVLLTGHSVKRF